MSDSRISERLDLQMFGLWLLDLEISIFLDFQISVFQNLQPSRFLDFLVSRFPIFKDF